MKEGLTQSDLAQLASRIPGWVSWIAQDADGTWWGYEVEPLPHDSGWYENEVGRCIRLKKTDPNMQWQKCCHQIG